MTPHIKQWNQPRKVYIELRCKPCPQIPSRTDKKMSERSQGFTLEMERENRRHLRDLHPIWWGQVLTWRGDLRILGLGLREEVRVLRERENA